MLSEPDAIIEKTMRSHGGSMKIRLTIFIFFFILVALPFHVLAGQKEQKGNVYIENFAPIGLTKYIRKVTVRFSEQMVAFGDLHLKDPFEIKCPVKGTGRWLDGKNWIYDFEEDLEAGVECEFKVKDNLKSLKGNPVKGERSFSFSTGGPAVKSVFPLDGTLNIDENQVFVLNLDGKAEESTIFKNAYFVIEGIKEPVSIDILKKEERDRLLKVYHRNYYPQKEKHEVLIRPKRRFPNNTNITFVWGKGIMSTTGIPTTKEQVFKFKTRMPFIASFECRRENTKAACIPLLPMLVRFSSPVATGIARNVFIRDGKNIYRPKIEDKVDFVESLSFPGPFLEKRELTIHIPKHLKDDAGRTLINANRFPLKVKTDAYPPLAKFSSRFGIIEKHDPVLPLTVRNIEPELKGRTVYEESFNISGRSERIDTDKAIIEWLKKVSSVGRSRSILKREKTAKVFTLPKPSGQKVLEVMGIPLERPGFYVVEIESIILGSALLGKNKTMYCPTAALVTDLSAHLKWGVESSLVWVTSLGKGEPVEGAEVVIRDCKGNAIWNGKTDDKGIAFINKRLPRLDELPQCEIKKDDDIYYDFQQLKPISSINSGLFVFVRKDNDMTFVHSSWDEGIEPYRFRLPYVTQASHVTAHTVLDRVLLRAGETVYMKHFLRRHTTGGIKYADDIIPKKVFIEHLGSKDRYEIDLKWNKTKGRGISEWVIPKEVKLGYYSVILTTKDNIDGDEGSASVFRTTGFRVEEFKIPLMKGIIKPVFDHVVNKREAEVDLMVEYLSGAGAKGLPVKLRSQLKPKYLAFDGHEDFIFGNGKVKEGIRKRSYDEESDYEEEDIDLPKSKESLKTLEFALGEGGTIRALIDNIPPSTSVQDLLTELEYKDPNGETQTVSRRITIYPSGVLLGIMMDTWAGSKETVKFHIKALDIKGRPVENLYIKSDIFKKNYYSHRKRLLGGFYSYEHINETKRVATICEGKTDKRGLLICEAKAPVSGSIIIEAKAMDDQGNPSYAKVDGWIAGKDDTWFDVIDTDRMDLIPEKKRYEPGETAIFQVRMPMREAHALVTVEREGIIDAFVTKISGKDPVIMLPIKENYAPNVFISALCVRGRIGDIKSTAMIDLGRPSYKLGISEIYVGWRPYELQVDVKPEKGIYKVRDKAVVKIKVKTSKEGLAPRDGEIAVAAVDEGLLELMDNKTWGLLEHMMQRRGYDIKTSTAQMQVVGKRHYGLKALPQGGGGGRQVTRELFDTLLFWKPNIALDEKGETSIEIPLNDSITGFIIVAVASANDSLFGSGRARIQTTQDIIISSSLPDLVRQGDRFKAVFHLRNTTKEPVDVDIWANIKERKEGKAEDEKVLPVILDRIAPGEAHEIGWIINVPEYTDRMTWEVNVKDKKGNLYDALKVSQRVIPVTPVRTIQSTIMRLDKDFKMDVTEPKNAIPKKGGLRVAMTPKISLEINSILEYMRHYPYVCLEQRVSKAVVLNDEAMWNRIMSEIPSYLDSNGLVKYFSRQFSGSDILTSYIIAIADEVGFVIPKNIESSMLQGLKNFVAGRLLHKNPLGVTDISLRKLSAIESLSRKNMAEASMLDSIGIEPEFLPTSSIIDLINILKKTKNVRDREKRLIEAENILRSRLNLQGTIMGFSTENRDNLWWLMTGVDVNCIKTVLTFMDDGRWKEDIPRLVRGIMGRQKAGRWDTTVANAWGILALKKFSRGFESESVTGTSLVMLDDIKKTLDWGKNSSGDSFLFAWKKQNPLRINHKGAGSPWVTVSSLAAIPRRSGVSTGFIIKKTIKPIEQKKTGEFSVSDVLRVRLDITSQADMTWVVVSDPVPAGSRIIKGGVLGDLKIPLNHERIHHNHIYPEFEEHAYEAFRAYYSFVPKGSWSIEYTIRLNNAGFFHLPETRVEALYSPEMFGEIPNKPFEVRDYR